MMKKLILVLFLFSMVVACKPTVVDITPETAATTSEVVVATPEVVTPTPTVEVPENALELIAEDYPLVDGSTSTFPLEMTIACKVFGVSCIWWDYSPFSPFDMTTRGIYPEEDIWLTDTEIGEKLFNIIHHGTHGSYMNLIQGDANIILVARQPSDDEIRTAKTRGVTLNIQPVALDAFVFLMNVENKLDELSLDTIREIYSGEYALWEEVGGGDGHIQPYQRNPNSGSQELMEKLVMQGTPMVDAPDMILEGMMGPFNAISGDPWGIGYSVFFYAEYMFTSETVKMIGVDGIYPTSESISQWKYPLTTEVYVVIQEDTPEDSTARLMRNWLLTEAGQAVVAESGYVPVR
jgi:phosphate transport system substrate-binding protein